MIQEFQGKRIRVMGRTVMDGGMLWMASSLSEVGFSVTGATRLALRLRADGTVKDPAAQDVTPRYAVYLDGEKIRDARMTREEETIEIFRGSTPRDAEIRLKKLSECTQSLLALAAIDTDGKAAPLPEMKRRIEFIGDSITCGFGVEAKREDEPFSTATENAEKSYAGIIAEKLGADRMLNCYSGHGIVSGYTDDPAIKNGSELVPPYYEKVGRNGFRLPSGRTVTDIPWDFGAWQPEVIVVNLGTNDLSWCMEYPERKEMFRKQYREFLKTVRKNNPTARMLCILGAMGEGLNEYMTAAVSDYMAETGDRNIRSMTLKEQDGKKNGFGALWHPSEVTQRELSETVLNALETLR